MAAIPISEIKIGSRFRKDVGDLSDLKASMNELGLLQPVVLDKQKNLIAGLRRIEAAREAGWQKIECRLIAKFEDATKALKAERDENTCRMQFKPTELAALGMALEKLERPKAEERKAKGQERGGGDRKSDKAKKSLGGNLPPSDQAPTKRARTRDVVGEAIGLSGRQYEKVKAVTKAAQDDPETFGPIAEEMDRTGNVSPSYDKVQELKGSPKSQNNGPTVSDLTAESARQTKAILKSVSDLSKQLSAYQKSKSGSFVNSTLVNRTLRELRQELNRAALAQPCKDCKGKACMLCRHVGFVTAGHYDQ